MKISLLPRATPLTGQERLPIVQGQETRGATFVEFFAWLLPLLPAWLKGDPGAAGNVAANILQLRAAPPSNVTMLYDGATFTWTIGNFTGQADDVNIVKADSTALSAGAWVRQGASKITYKGITTGQALDRLNNSAQLDAYLAGLNGQYAEDCTAVVTQLLARAAVDDRDAAGHTHLPRGQYRQTKSFKIPNSAVLSGDGPHATKLQGYIDGNRNFPILTNAESGGALFQIIRDIGIWGGTAGYYINANEGCDDIRFQDVLFYGQTEGGIVCERLFQTSELRNVEFNNCARGIWVKEHTSNAIIMIGGSFKNLSEAALDLNGVEALICVGTRFEGGGNPNKITIDLQNVRNVSFVSCYFENTHRTLLRTRRTGGIGPSLVNGGIVSFTNCHFTHAIGEVPYLWDVEGPISFADCDFNIPMRVPSQAQVRGHNRNLIHCTRNGELVSKQIRIEPAKQGDPPFKYLVTFDLADAFPAVDNLNTLTARLTLTYGRIDVAGGGFTTLSREYLVTLKAVAGQPITGRVKLVSSDDELGGANLDVALVGATSQAAQIAVTPSGMATSDPVSNLSFNIAWQQTGSRPGNLFAVGLA